MDQQDIDTADEPDESDNKNKPIDTVEIEELRQTNCDEYSQSQDLFDDDESFTENKNNSLNKIDFDVPTVIARNNVVNSPSIDADLYTVLTQTPKICSKKELESPYNATVPSIPRSLIPFISTVNESWNSDLETPQAKTAAELINLKNIERRENSASKSCEIMDRKTSDKIRSNGIIPDVTTPNGYLIAEEDERILKSPILNPKPRKRRPKRRILKSLNDITIPGDNSAKEKTNFCPESEIEELSIDKIGDLPSEETLTDNKTGSSFIMDENCSIHNTNIQFTQDETIADKESRLNVQDSTSTQDFGEDCCLMNQRFQGTEEFFQANGDDTFQNEDEEVPGLKTDRKEKSVAELVKEIKELEKNGEEQIIEYNNYDDIPMDVFMRDAEALENAQMIPLRTIDKPIRERKKKNWGLVSFTEMCLLEEEENSDEAKEKEEAKAADDSNKIKSTIKDSENISISSFTEKEDEPAIDIDEFSPWFYQPNDVIKPEILDGSKKFIKENSSSTKKNGLGMDSIESTTASGRRSTVREDEIKRVAELHEEIPLQDDKYYTAERFGDKTEDYGTNNKENEATILQNSYPSIGFSTANRKRIKINEDKIKAAEKMYNEIVSQDAKYTDGKISRNKSEDRGTYNKENEATIPQNSYPSMGFSTGSGKRIEINDDRMKAAEKMYKDTISTDNLKLSSDFSEVPISRGLKRRQEDNDNDFDRMGRADSSVRFKTASGNSFIVSETMMKKAKIMDRSSEILENQLPRDKNRKTESSNRLNVLSSSSFGKTNMISDDKESDQRELQNLFKVNQFGNNLTDNAKNLTSRTSDHENKRSFEISAGFNTAGGIAIEISNKALSNARNLLKEVEEEEKESSKSVSSISRTDKAETISCDTKKISFNRERSAAGFTNPLINGEKMKIFEDKLMKSKKLFYKEKENTTPDKFLLKRNSAAMETPVSSNVLASDTLALRSLSENMSANVFETSKKVKFNSDLQARKLFDDKTTDDDEEVEHREKIVKENDKNLLIQIQKSFNKNENYSPNHHHLRTDDEERKKEKKKNVPFIWNSTAGLYAKSEMFQINDRLIAPEFKAEKSCPLNEDNGTKKFGGKLDKSNTKLEEKKQNDRKIATYSEEIEASTEALLADEENSLDGKLWAPAITCSPTVTEDRDISVKPITSGLSCGEVVQEPPKSPIFGAKHRSRRKVKRNSKKNLPKKETNEDLEVKLVTEDSHQSSGVITPGSDSSKESNKNRNTEFIVNVLTSKLEKLKETSPRLQFLDNESQSLVRRNVSEIDEREAMDYFLENRISATLEQEKRIRAKKKHKPKPIPGSLFLRKTEDKESRVSWRQVTNGVSPTPRTSEELTDLGIHPNVTEVTAASSIDYKFNCLHFYSGQEIRENPFGIEISDGGRLIFDENGYAGVAEFEKAFMASPGVDPALVPLRWVENHYRWIIWKLASIDRMKFGDLTMPRMLTLRNVMEQLKYRYDREIDKSQRSALRRIIEKDDPPSRRIILCVATIKKIENIQALEKSAKLLTPTSYWKMELTDGWYSVTATIDSAMAHLIAFGKVREGTKLVTCRAELLNCEQGCSPLEIPCDVTLKIHTNSTRRSRWDSKLGYCKYSNPIPTSLQSILPNGGLIGKLKTIIARVYPVQYFEKLASGQAIFRNNKCEDKALMIYEEERQKQIDNIYAKVRDDFENRNRKLCNKKSREYSSEDDKLSEEEAFRDELESMLHRNLPPPRKVTLVLKVRVMDGDSIAILTIWAPGEDIIDLLREGNRVSIHNVQTSGKRSGELQLTVGHQSFIKPEESNVPSFSQRCLTSISEVAVAGFNPPFGEFDTVGIVASLGPAPHGMKNFEVVNLAFPNSEDSSHSCYLSILFWEGIGAHGFSDILCIGETVACTNIQWRRGAHRTIPMAYSTEHSTFTRNPRKIYLRSAFDYIKKHIKDPMGYASQCAREIAIEHEKRTNIVRSPAVQSTPNKKLSPSGVSLQDKFAVGISPGTPQAQAQAQVKGGIITGVTTPAKYSVQRRLEKLQWYPEPPDLSPVALNPGSAKVNRKFIPPVRTPDHS